MKRTYFIDYNLFTGGSSHPLSHYFINSSHNTYIMNHQIKGNASECGYILHLNMKKGGCIEIDPVSIKNEDVAISHAFIDGKTMNNVSLTDILKVVTSWIEKNKEKVIGPIILSFDNKTISKEEDQKKVWKVLKEELYDEKHKDKIWYYPLNKIVVDDKINLDSLKGKILIKWDQCFAIDNKNKTCLRTEELNKINKLPEEKLDVKRTESSEEIAEGIKAPKEEKITVGNYTSGKGLIPPTWWLESGFFDRKKGEKIEEFIPKKDEHLRWVHFAKTNYPITKTILSDKVKGEMMSISWGKGKFDTINKNIVVNSINNFVRVFPPGTNIASGNYNPVSSWNNGCQLVALNIQKQDKYYFINQEFFRDGPYRLKPSWLLTKEPKEEEYNNNKTITITIKNLKLNNNPTKKDYYKKMELYGPKDNYDGKIKPKSVTDDSVSWVVTGVSKTAPIIYLNVELDIRKAFDVENRTTGKKVLNNRKFQVAKEIDYKKKEGEYKDTRIVYYERDSYAENTLEKDYPRCFPRAVLNSKFEKEKIDQNQKYLDMIYDNDLKYVTCDITYKWN